MKRLRINGHEVTVKDDATILDAARQINIDIPTLCHLKIEEIGYDNKPGSCRVCIVENADTGRLVPACVTPVEEGMNINTESIQAVRARRTNVELLLSDHPNACLTCAKNTKCDLQKLAHDLGVREMKYGGEQSDYSIDKGSKSIVRDANKCILCNRCETMCTEVQTVGALSMVGRGFESYVGSAYHLPMNDTTCTFCGQCLSICPTGALTEEDNTEELWEYLADPKKFVIVQTAPAVRVALGEEFGLPAGTDVTGKMVSALRVMGFDRVFDTNYAADLTIMEEASEFIDRVENDGKLPILTSCCPGWVRFFETQFHDMLDIPSSAKSPHEMFGAVAKTYLAKQMDIDPKDIVCVSIMPCVAKKYEASRMELSVDGNPDVDLVITTRELARLIKESGIHFTHLPEEYFDNLMGESTGAGAIFGATGGVIEATLRTAHSWLTGDDLTVVEFRELQGFTGVKETSVDIAGREFKIAVCNGLGNTRKVLEALRDGDVYYDAIEVMACPGGCIGGAGQPYHHGDMSILTKRTETIHKIDRQSEIRLSHENPMIKKLYAEFLGEPYGEKAHELLHTYHKAKPTR
ncbi:MAG: 4Fe-4S binding protein [Eubacteriaceae bacterium]|jgi:NADH-quinone oxidoreductase subunit G|nr:4Fe-4S binding protein [Eubacteriaceae bacterium]